MQTRTWFAGLCLWPFTLFAQGPSPFIQPYKTCKEINGATVCANVAITGATQAGVLYSDVASCDEVRTQRRFSIVPPAGETNPNDPRLKDEGFQKELAWVTTQAQTTGCVCCHRSASKEGTAIWDLSAPGIWTDQLSDRGVALLSGKMPSEILGVFEAKDNFGFDRKHTGIPTTDINRMKAFFQKEIDRRQITDAAITAFPPLGGAFLEAVKNESPKICAEGQGISNEGLVQWSGGPACYVYTLPALATNPLIPPSTDTPQGTVWRINVDHRAEAIASGVTLGSVPNGSVQKIPADNAVPQLKAGQVYRLYVLKDVLAPITNCFFTYQGA